jgi:hypothetical protein
VSSDLPFRFTVNRKIEECVEANEELFTDLIMGGVFAYTKPMASAAVEAWGLDPAVGRKVALAICDCLTQARLKFKHITSGKRTPKAVLNVCRAIQKCNLKFGDKLALQSKILLDAQPSGSLQATPTKAPDVTGDQGGTGTRTLKNLLGLSDEKRPSEPKRIRIGAKTSPNKNIAAAAPPPEEIVAAGAAPPEKKVAAPPEEIAAAGAAPPEGIAAAGPLAPEKPVWAWSPDRVRNLYGNPSTITIDSPTSASAATSSPSSSTSSPAAGGALDPSPEKNQATVAAGGAQDALCASPESCKVPDNSPASKSGKVPDQSKSGEVPDNSAASKLFQKGAGYYDPAQNKFVRISLDKTSLADMVPGPKGLAFAKFVGEEAFETEVPNLMIEKMAAGYVAKPKAKPKARKSKAMKKTRPMKEAKKTKKTQEVNPPEPDTDEAASSEQEIDKSAGCCSCRWANGCFSCTVSYAEKYCNKKGFNAAEKKEHMKKVAAKRKKLGRDD